MSATIRRGTLVSFDSATWTALVMLDGSLSEVSMAVGEWVPAALLAADDQVAVLLFEDTNNEDGVILGPYGGLGPMAYPALSGLTVGQPLRATSATAAAFGALDLANANAVTGVLPVSNLGTTQSPTFAVLSLTSYLEQTESAAPGTPAAGFLRWYADSTQSWGYFKNDAGRAVPAGVATLSLEPDAAFLQSATLTTLLTHHRALNFSASADQNANWYIKLPPGWGGRQIVTRILWASNNTSTLDAVWKTYWLRQANGVALSATANETSGENLSAGWGATTFPIAKTLAAMTLTGAADGEGIVFGIQRTGALCS